MDPSQSGKKPHVNQQHRSVLESLKDVGKSTTDSLKNDLFAGTAESFMQQILNRYPQPQKRFSGEIQPGENLSFSDVYSGRREVQEKERSQLLYIEQIRQEEHAYVERTHGELKMKLIAIQEQIDQIMIATPQLSDAVEDASLYIAENQKIGKYHVGFIEHLLKIVQDFRAHISEATHWMDVFNTRSQKKNVWGSNYKKHGAKYLLSQEHYLSRSSA